MRAEHTGRALNPRDSACFFRYNTENETLGFITGENDYDQKKQ